MKRTIITTGDGSQTIHLEGWEEHYHSKHGAIQEAYHVFIKHGLSLFENRRLSILEMGFGTGLNALITLLESKNYGVTVHYTAVEAFPVIAAEWQQLRYGSELKGDHLKSDFTRMHEAPWNQDIDIVNGFVLHKQLKEFQTVSEENLFDLVYFDAFGARVQPELWGEEIFGKMFKAMRPGGVLVTYAAKGSVRRAMQAVGFVTERLQGPPGKREMLRATKPI